MIELVDVRVPSFGCASALPPLGAAEYRQRRQAVLGAMKRRGVTSLVVYGDREHFANMTYLTGYDPRFEEALLVIHDTGRSLLLVGNEGMGYLPELWPQMEVGLFQEFSLPGQPRGQTPPLRQTLTKFGLRRGATVGCVGWKPYVGRAIEGGATALDVPSYIADLLRDIAGGRRFVVNAADIFIRFDGGLRLVNSAAQIAQFEFAATRVSDGVWSVIKHIRPGVTERQLSRYQVSDGLPHSCHHTLSTGAKAARGLASPGDGVVKRGDAFTTCMGLWGSLTARSACVARGPADVPRKVRHFYHELAVNYFDVFSTWYETVRVGATAGEVFAAAESRRNAKLFDFALNPGHFVHLDEWTNSPFHAGSTVKLRSGMAFQMDIIPVPKGPFCAVNSEDGLVLADEKLRSELARKHPACFRRMKARQKFMREKLGINVGDSLLPLSSYPAVFAPYLLSPGKVLARRG